MTHPDAAPGLVDTRELTARVEAMFDQGQVFSEPRTPSGTDQLLDRLFARSPKRVPPMAHKPHGKARPHVADGSAGAPGGRGRSWLDLPSLAELIDRRRELLHRAGERRTLELEVERGDE